MAKQSSIYLFQNNKLTGDLSKISFSIFYITNSATTTETGEPIGVPVIY